MNNQQLSNPYVVKSNNRKVKGFSDILHFLKLYLKTHPISYHNKLLVVFLATFIVNFSILKTIHIFTTLVENTLRILNGELINVIKTQYIVMKPSNYLT